MKTHFKIQRSLLNRVRQDLARPHSYASERVGFIVCKVDRLDPDGWLLLAADYFSVADEDYVDDDSVGAMIGSAAIRKMMQFAYDDPFSIVHVHMHEHEGTPYPSSTDVREMAELIPNFWHVRSNFPHAAIVLSLDSMTGTVWDPISKSKSQISDLSVVGFPMQLIRHYNG